MMVLVFVVCLYLNVGLIFSGLFAILIAFAVAYLAFPRLHSAASADVDGWLHRRRATKKPKKSVEAENRSVEDEYVDERSAREGF